MIQNFKNHKRFSTPFHFVTMPFVMLAIGVAVSLFIENQDVLHGLIVCAFILIGVAMLFARFFALKVQDRAIRAEENLRYFSLTGKLLPKKLRGSQIIALRFAPDEEFVELVDRVLSDNLSSKEIKQSIVAWRADHHRI